MGAKPKKVWTVEITPELKQLIKDFETSALIDVSYAVAISRSAVNIKERRARFEAQQKATHPEE